MSEQDKYDCDAAGIFERSGLIVNDYSQTVQEVAAAFRAHGLEIERRKADFDATVTILGRYRTKFAAAEEQITQLKAQLGDCLDRLDRHHDCGYTTNQRDPCPTCEYIKDMAATAQPGPLGGDSGERWWRIKS